MSDTFDTDGQDEGNSNEYRQGESMGTISDHGQNIGNSEVLPTPHKQAVTAIQRVADVPEITDIDSAISFIQRSYIDFSELEASFKAEKKRHKERLMLLCEQFGIKVVPIDSERKLLYKTVKKNVFDSDAIKKALEFNEKQLLVLPKNPDWKKTAIESIAETCEFVKVEETMELVEDKPKAKKELVEFNPAFVK